MEKKRSVIIAILLSLSIINFTRLTGNENIRSIQFFSIFTIGLLSGLLITHIVSLLKANKK